MPVLGEKETERSARSTSASGDARREGSLLLYSLSFSLVFLSSLFAAANMSVGALWSGRRTWRVLLWEDIAPEREKGR